MVRTINNLSQNNYLENSAARTSTPASASAAYHSAKRAFAEAFGEASGEAWDETDTEGEHDVEGGKEGILEEDVDPPHALCVDYKIQYDTDPAEQISRQLVLHDLTLVL